MCQTIPSTLLPRCVTPAVIGTGVDMRALLEWIGFIVALGNGSGKRPLRSYDRHRAVPRPAFVMRTVARGLWVRRIRLRIGPALHWETPTMTTRFGRRAIAGAAALLPAAAMIGSAHAQAGPETTFDRIRRTRTLRIAALPGELPYFQKDLSSGEWSGACIDMAKDIAKVFDAQLAYVESTYGNSVLDLQSNKVDLAFALNPTPQRALSIRFTQPIIIHPFGCVARKGLEPKTWSDINHPDVKIAVDLGSLHETVARRFASKAQIVGF